MKVQPKTGDRENKRFLIWGREFTCPNCKWILLQAASKNDHKRNVVCECPPLIIFMPEGFRK
jgi:hypothetical protein